MIATKLELVDAHRDEIGESLASYRIVGSDSVRRMRDSLLRHGQISPVVCYRGAHDGLELVDGFKRLRAARELSSMTTLLVRFIPADDTTAKAAMLTLNRVTGRTRELEEARVVRSLVREHGLSQAAVAELLFRHKSWVSRRLALVERLCPDAQEMLAVGLLSPTAARELNRLPAGNQQELVDVARREALSGAELKSVVDTLASCTTGEQRAWLLDRPREAIAQDRRSSTKNDPRLSAVGNRILRKLALLRELLGEVEGSLAISTSRDLTAQDALLLEGRVEEVGAACLSFAEATSDFVPGGQRR